MRILLFAESATKMSPRDEKTIPLGLLKAPADAGFLSPPKAQIVPKATDKIPEVEIYYDNIKVILLVYAASRRESGYLPYHAFIGMVVSYEQFAI